jgi:biotin-(acetyl-CoA carboxylase) ligase
MAGRPLDPPHHSVTAVPGGAPETVERFGHAYRHFAVAVSAGVMAGAWARQEDGPAGATVTVEREVSPLGRLGQHWHGKPESTLSVAMVLRPSLPPEEADVTWLVAGLGAIGGAEALTGRELSAWWPDAVIDAEEQVVASTKAEIQLGPGQVRSAVLSMRLDLERLGLAPEQRDDLLEAVVGAVDEASVTLGQGPQAAAAAYGARCRLLGRRLKVRLLPKGETRGAARAVDQAGRLELASATGMVERISVDMLRDFQVV